MCFLTRKQSDRKQNTYCPPIHFGYMWLGDGCGVYNTLNLLSLSDKKKIRSEYLRMKSYRAVCTSRVGMCLGGGRVDNTARPALHPTLPLPQLINYSSTVQSPCPPLSTAQQPVFSSPSLSRSDSIVTGAVRPYKLEQGGVTLATQQ